ncbi:MAG: SPOR domain-containing protein [Burkholderiales bacterium]|nr:SPOR domain-containing protein [Burkholderiales bacterium]
MATDPANPLAAGDTAELYRAAIGPRGQDYYLRQFTRFDAAGKTGASWHWPAYWNTLNWLAYRKMWGQALAYLAAVLGMALLVFGVGKLVFSYSDTTGLLLFLAFLTVAFVVPGLYANAWYYNFCNEKISAALRATQEVKDACEVLATQASSNKRLLGLASANVALMALLAGMVAFLFNPAQDFMQFAQGGPAKPSVPVMPEMAAGTQPVVAPPSVAASEPSPAPVPPAVTAEAPKPESPKLEAPVAAVPAEVAGLTSDTQIEHYLARMAEKAAAPSDEQTAAKAAKKAADKTDAKVERKPEVKVAEKAEPSPTVAVKATRASEPVRPAAAKTVQVAAASTDKPAAPKATSAKVAKADATKSDTAASAPKAAADSAAPASVDKPKASAKASKTKKSWYVQAGAFAQEGNAQNVRLRIEAAGLETSTAPYETQAGRLIRVRVGPFTAKADAEKAALQVKALDLPAVLFKE